MSEEIKKINEIDEYSEQLREVLAKTPNWFLRWGAVFILFTVFLVFYFSWVIKYPDVLVSEITITTENQPIDIICKTDGEVKEIFIENNQEVRKGEVLAYIDNKANYKDVKILSSYLKRYSISIIHKKKIFPENLQLGYLQESYNEFLNSYSNYWLQKINKPIDKEIKSLHIQNTTSKILIQQIKEKKELFQKELQLINKDFHRDSTLHSKGIISDKEIEDKEVLFLQKKREYQDVLNQISNVNISITRIEREIIILYSRNIEISTNNKQTLLLKLEKLKGDINGWEKEYLLISPINGIVSFNQFLERNKYLKKDENIFTIIQNKAGELTGQLSMPIIRSGKVRLGQKVNIKLNNYPYQEYGMLVGEIKNISLTPTNDSYVVTVILKNGLNTTYGKELIFKQKMKGSAEIITEDLRLIERIFYQFRKLIMG